MTLVIFYSTLSYVSNLLNVKVKQKFYFKRLKVWAPVAHTYNPSYSGGRNQEDHG
jgi:hypothetical protein